MQEIEEHTRCLDGFDALGTKGLVSVSCDELWTFQQIKIQTFNMDKYL
jgi:hypothetical protein